MNFKLINSLAASEHTLEEEWAQQLLCPWNESAEWVDQSPDSSRSMAQQRVGLGWVAQASLQSAQFPLYLHEERERENTSVYEVTDEVNLLSYSESKHSTKERHGHTMLSVTTF